MPPLTKTIGVAVDLAGCPNRCRHCYLGSSRGPELPREVLQEVADTFWQWTRPGQSQPYFQQVDVLSWLREPDYSDDYRQLHELCSQLSRRAARRYELLSIWRLARDPSYASWASHVGPRACQISFFGTEELTDDFHRRRGAYRDNLAATNRLLEAGMIPRWQIFLTKPGLADLDDLMRLIDELELVSRVADLGETFTVFCHPPGPDGDGWDLEDIRIDADDLVRVPQRLLDSTRRHLGGKIDWLPEADLVERTLAGEVIPPHRPDETWLFIDSDYDVFANCGELDEYWRLGNFNSDRLDVILDNLETDGPPGLQTAFHAPCRDLAERFGRPDSNKLYSPTDLLSRWIHLSVRTG